MGSGCSSQKNITIPTRIITIRHKYPQLRGEILNHVGRSDSGEERDTDGRNEGNTDGELNIGEKNENDKNNDKTKMSNSIKSPLNIQYDIKEVGIGEFFMEDHIIKLENSKQNKETQKDKVEMVKKILNNIKNALGPKLLELVHDLYNQTDVLLLEYSKQKPQKYIKMFKNGGPPMKYRWSLWKNRLDLDQYYISKLYEKMRFLTTSYENDIKKDIHRTFPEEPYFSSEAFGYIGQEQLFRVLKAIAIYLPNVGYCQGMNFIVAFLLMINGGNEQEAFWFFVALARNPDFLLMGFFEKNFPLLNLYNHIFHEIFKKELPNLNDHLLNQQIPDQLWITKWLLTLFLYSLPPIVVVRIWDFIFTENMFALIKVSVGLMKIIEKDLINLDTMGFDILLRHLKGDYKLSQDCEYTFSIQSIDPELLIKISKGIILTNEQISQFTIDYKSKVSTDNGSLYYEFYSDYHNNMRSPSYLMNFQKDIDQFLIKYELMGLKEESPNNNKDCSILM